MLDAGVWPENDYTAGIPVPPGRVAWAMLDPGHESCSISLTDLTENDYRSYRKQLEQAGFTVLEETSEEVRGQAYVSIGTLLSGETVSLEHELHPRQPPAHDPVYGLVQSSGQRLERPEFRVMGASPPRVLQARRAFSSSMTSRFRYSSTLQPWVGALRDRMDHSDRQPLAEIFRRSSPSP